MKPILRTLPGDDPAFRAAFEAAAEDAVDAAEAQRRIRERYPLAAVVVRDAEPGSVQRVRWDAYRYAPSVAAERWWRSPELPWAVLDDARTFVDASESLAAIVEAPREAIIGQPIDAFAGSDDPTVRPDLEGLWAVFLATGE